MAGSSGVVPTIAHVADQRRLHDRSAEERTPTYHSAQPAWEKVACGAHLPGQRTVDIRIGRQGEQCHDEPPAKKHTFTLYRQW
jgi:hypothetical protein